MKELKKRLNKEFIDLLDKKETLEIFIGSKKFHTLKQIQKSLLTIQLDAMTTYATCLYERINNLKNE